MSMKVRKIVIYRNWRCRLDAFQEETCRLVVMLMATDIANWLTSCDSIFLDPRLARQVALHFPVFL